MWASYQVWVRSKSNALLAVLTQDDIISLRVKRVVNGVSSHEIVLASAALDKAGLFEVDGHIEVWRKPRGAGMYMEYEGFHRVGIYEQDQEGKETFTSRGVGYADILRRRIIAAPAGTSGSRKTGPAETVAKAYVYEQIVAPSIAERAISGFTIEPDLGRGSTIDISRAWRGLLDVLQEIAAVGGGDFDVIGTETGFVFRWYPGQRGADRRSELTFSTEFGNMEAPQFTVEPAGANTCLVLGAGEGAGRGVLWVPSSTAYAGLDRIEIARDARDTDSEDVMRSRGSAALEELRGGTRLTFHVVQTASARYGVDYGLGDLVRVRYRDYVMDAKITGVTITLRDAEQIELEFQNV